MSQSRWGDLYNQRAMLLNRARELARTGRHADHRSIITHLETVEGFADAGGQVGHRAFILQLDRLCAMARNPAL